MRYVSMPIRGHVLPTEDRLTKMFALFNDKSAGPVFVHCRRGADRTGTVVASYRIAHDHWDNLKAPKGTRRSQVRWDELDTAGDATLRRAAQCAASNNNRPFRLERLLPLPWRWQ